MALSVIGKYWIESLFKILEVKLIKPFGNMAFPISFQMLNMLLEIQKNLQCLFTQLKIGMIIPSLVAKYYV